MRAVVHDKYGPPEVLRLADLDRPVQKEDEILVRIHASTVTRTSSREVARTSSAPAARVLQAPTKARKSG